MNLIFAGSPDFAAQQLRALVDAGLRPVGVLSQPDRPAGRGQQLRPPSVAQLAAQLDIPLQQPARLDEAALRALAQWKPDLVVVAAYGLLLPQALLQMPAHGCLNVHASLLPRWRGAAPVQSAIRAGDPRTGISFMRMDRGLDTGDVLATAALDIEPDDTGGSLTERLAELGAQHLPAVVRMWCQGQLQPQPQPQEGVTHAPKLRRDDARLDWGLPAAELALAVRAFHPWPMAWCERRGHGRVRILRAEEARHPEADELPGTLARDGDGAPLVRCGRGWLRLAQVQLPGGRPQSGAEALRGGGLAAGERLL